MIFLKQSTAYTAKIGPFIDDTDGKTAETGLTLSQADIRLSKNGGDIAQKNESTACSHDELGYYDCPLDATDTGTLGKLQLFVHESGALPVFHEFMVVTANVYDTLFSTDKLEVDVAQWLGQNCAAVTNNGVPEVDITHIAGAAVATGSAQLGVNVVQVEGSDATNQIRDSVVDDATRIDASALNALSAKAPSKSYLTGTANSDGDIQADEATGNFQGSVGSVAGAVGSVTGAVGSVTGNVGGNVSGSVASVTGAVGSVTGNVGGNVTGSVGSVAAGGITAASIATDAIDADALAADAIAEINATVDTALTDIHLDHLLAAEYDPASKPGNAAALLNELVESDSGVSRFTANALEQAPSGTGASAASIAHAVWDEPRAGHTVSGSFGDVETTADIAAAVRDVSNASPAAGSLGEGVKNILTDTGTEGVLVADGSSSNST